MRRDIMAIPASELKKVTLPPSRLRCWVESLILGLGIPSAIWVVSRLISVSIPAAVHGSPEQRFFFWFSAGVVVEWLFVIGLWVVLRRRGISFADFGVWRLGTWPAWVVALLLAAISIASNLRLLPRMHLPISNAFLPHGFHLFAAVTLGVTAGFCEEVLFRAYLMTQFHRSGYGSALQVLMPGCAFALAHAGYLNQGFLVWLGIMLPTALLGMMWGVAYLLGRRSLLPTIVAHFLNDATALPWIIFVMVTSR
jgi:membrane protease YdiL (CAAX protease family)